MRRRRRPRHPARTGRHQRPGNLRLAHRRCNGQRGSRLPELDWPDHLQVYEPAPLWPVLQRARKRPGEWEVVGVVGNDVAGAAQEWLRETATDIARGDWETSLQAVGTQLSMLALRLNRPAA